MYPRNSKNNTSAGFIRYITTTKVLSLLLFIVSTLLFFCYRGEHNNNHIKPSSSLSTSSSYTASNYHPNKKYNNNDGNRVTSSWSKYSESNTYDYEETKREDKELIESPLQRLKSSTPSVRTEKDNKIRKEQEEKYDPVIEPIENEITTDDDEDDDDDDKEMDEINTEQPIKLRHPNNNKKKSSKTLSNSKLPLNPSKKTKKSTNPSSSTGTNSCSIPSLASSIRQPLNHSLPWMSQSHPNALIWYSYTVYKLPYELSSKYNMDRNYLLCYDNDIFIGYRFILEHDLKNDPLANNTLFLEYSQYVKQIQSVYTLGYSLFEHWCPYDQYSNKQISSEIINQYLGHIISILQTLQSLHEKYALSEGTAILHPIQRYRLYYTILRIIDELTLLEKENNIPNVCWTWFIDQLQLLTEDVILGNKEDVDKLIAKDLDAKIIIRILRTSTKYFENQYIGELMPYNFIQDQIDPISDPNNITQRCGKNEFPIFILQGPNGNPKQTETIEVFRKANIPFGVIHLSDENYEDHSEKYYSPPNLRFVMRNYYRPDLQTIANNVNSPIIQTPIGYTEGWWEIGPTTEYGKDIERRNNEREYMWIFVGSLARANRREVLNSIQNAQLGNTLFFDADGYKNFDTQMPRAEYAVKARKTLFQFILWGNWNMETFRICESLESGSIPIMTREGPNQKYNYWDGDFGPRNPLMQIERWDDVPALIRNLLTRPEQLEAYRLHVVDFWMATKWFLRQQLVIWMKHGTLHSCSEDSQ